VRTLLLLVSLFALISENRAQSWATFRAVENCPDWSCVLDLAAAHPADRFDRSLPWRLPLRDAGWLSSPFGLRRHPIGGAAKLHRGVDIAARAGTPVSASGSGWAKGGYSPTLGLYVVVDHRNGFRSRYAHLQGYRWSGERFVQQGECLGWVGATGRVTGAHLHWSVDFRGKPLDPLELRRAVLNLL
jgi:murein DD-endopeptidase MepM/ murein hydrolase activator NlpD